jgi:hypothetical protein
MESVEVGRSVRLQHSRTEGHGLALISALIRLLVLRSRTRCLISRDPAAKVSAAGVKSDNWRSLHLRSVKILRPQVAAGQVEGLRNCCIMIGLAVCYCMTAGK